MLIRSIHEEATVAQSAADRRTTSGIDRSTWLAGGGLFGGLGAAACCVLPVLLLALGVGGAWLGTLRALEPYQPIFAVVALGFIAAGFWSLRRRRTAVCDADGYCATRTARWLTLGALWLATGLVALSFAWPWLFPILIGQ